MSEEMVCRKRRLSSFQIIILGFAGVILLGALLLMLPISATARCVTPFHEALFTATSAVCVTGLVVQDTGSYWSVFGQAVILTLIQIGGLGVVTVVASFALLSGRRISLMQRSTMQDAISAPKVGGIVRLTRFILRGTFLIELIGALAMLPVFCRDYGWCGIWMAVFHSISAFCNAGFDLFGGYRSLTHLQHEPVILLTLGGLILVGGLGFPVILECLRARFRWRKLPLHAKLVLTVTAGLIAFGTLAILALEWDNPRTLDGGLTVWQKLYNSLFQSITFRTAGFASLDQASLTDPSKLIGSVLMFVGTSSASTGGGVKTTTAALLALVVVQVVRGHERITVFKREISADTARRAVAIVLIAFSAILIATCAISVIERGRGHDFLDLLFETTSAFSTTGLSSVNTTTLTPASQWLLMPLMYFGRVGPLTLAYALANRLESRRANRVHYPEEKIMIG